MEIGSKFADYFRIRCSANCAIRGTKLRNDYENKRRDYKGHFCGEAQPLDAELIDSVISKLKKYKAADLDTLTAEHLQYSQSLTSCPCNYTCKTFQYNDYK